MNNEKNRMEDNNYQDRAEVKEYTKGYRAGKQGKGNSRNKGKSNRKPSASESVLIPTNSTDNDYTWYVPANQLITDVASFPSAYDLYAYIRTHESNHNTTLRTGKVDCYVPPILSYNIVPCMGETGALDSALTQAGLQLFGALQAKNSRNLQSQFEQTDVAMAIIASSNAYACYEWCARAYGTAETYVFTNKYLPKALLEAQGFVAESIMDNLASYRSRLNRLGLKLANIYLPKAIDYTNRQVFLYQNIYMDADDISKAQLYVTRPMGFWKWVEGDLTSPYTYLEYRNIVSVENNKAMQSPVYASGSWSDTLLTGDQALDILDELITALFSSQDINYIGAAFMKAFGEGTMYQVNMLDETYRVTPSYNKEVLSQLENAYIGKMYGIIPTGSTNAGDEAEWATGLLTHGKVYAQSNVNEGYLTQYMYFVPELRNDKMDMISEAVFADTLETYMINFHHSSPSPEDIMVATRLSCVPNLNIANESGKTIGYQLSNMYNTEYVAGVRLISNGLGSSGIGQSSSSRRNVVPSTGIDNLYVNLQGTGSVSPNYEVAFGRLQGRIDTIGRLAAFDWHPRVYSIQSSTNATTNQVVWDITDNGFDWNEFVLISKLEMKRLSEIALLGLFTPKELPDLVQLIHK